MSSLRLRPLLLSLTTFAALSLPLQSLAQPHPGPRGPGGPGAPGGPGRGDDRGGRGDDRGGRGDDRGGRGDDHGGQGGRDDRMPPPYDGGGRMPPPGPIPGHGGGRIPGPPPYVDPRDPRGPWVDPRNPRVPPRWGRGPIVFGERGGRRIYRPAGPIVFRPPVRYYTPLPDFDFNARIRYWRNVEGRSIDLLGTTTLELNSQDYDVIQVQQCGIKQINLRVLYNDAIINEIIVNYRDGGFPSEIDIDGRFDPDASFGDYWLDLPGYDRCVSDIVIIGRTLSDHFFDRNEAVVEVFGER